MEQEQDVIVVQLCPHCEGKQQEDGSIRWSCDALHPEVLAQMEERDRRKDEEA